MLVLQEHTQLLFLYKQKKTSSFIGGNVFVGVSTTQLQVFTDQRQHAQKVRDLFVNMSTKVPTVQRISSL